MKRVIVLFFSLALTSLLSAHSGFDYSTARIKDANIHFEMVLEQMVKAEHITAEASKQIHQALSKTSPQIPEEWEQLFTESNVSEKTAQALINAWNDSFGYAYSLNAVEHDVKGWLQLLQASKSEPHAQKMMRATIYEQTKAACLNGYKLGSRTRKLDWPKIRKMQKGSTVIETLAPIEAKGPYARTEVTIVEGDTIDVTRNLQKQGYRPVALNFANKIIPGGGVVRGSKAQEEDLFRRSSYFLGLDIKYNSHLSKQMDGKYLIPEYGAIYTPHVEIIRGPESEGYSFIEPFEIDFIASAAYDLTVGKKDAPASKNSYQEGMKEKIRNILRLSSETKHDCVVLGAFGCGAFKNDPKVVAFLFKEVLAEPEFQGHFRLIAFAILNNPNAQNYETFQEVFQ